jgi:hypothetical protein
METATLHIGKKVKELFENQHLSNYKIIKTAEINEAYLSKVYTSRSIQPWKLKRLLFKINREFDLDLSPENIYKAS